MAKVWKQGDIIPLDHLNDLEKKAEAYDKLIQEKKKAAKKSEKE
ncbi:MULTISPECIES: hypothetical protein [Anaerovoracaceae]|uniref:Uncharacterized protein n=1 Tax=Hominibacterium faecale TaxID=2839743 RepID=A0A9J6QZI3_9FIRM|nr:MULTISPECIES: hypothetical protein [Eubacteriales Family XIII. Incertae Sedis]MCU7380942.1 hypothetical protein [Hominibacterium faecale]